jgi:hypothetical protein
MSRSIFLRKCSDISHNYGKKARNYFEKHPCCEDCGEERIAVLAIHHKIGKEYEVFKTLCNNCHALEHCSHPEYTHKDHLKECEALNVENINKAALILGMLDRGVPIRNIIFEAKTSLNTIKAVMNSNGFVSTPRKGYVKN